MTHEEKHKIISNDYADFIIEYNRNPKLLERFPEFTTHYMNDRYAVVYTPASLLDNHFINQYGYKPLPRLYGLTSIRSLESSGVNKIRRLERFNLTGTGVLIGIIDTGIDYTNPIFIREDGSSKIQLLWDQTIDSDDNYPENKYYGTLYSKEDINQALKSPNPLEIVPSKDEIGHGTMLAGVTVGSEVPDSDFAGVVPNSDLIVVKLKPAKPVLRDFFKIPQEAPCYQENDILWAIYFVMEEAKKLGRPISICIGLGTSQGAHDGTGALSNSINVRGDFSGVCISIAMGNEGNGRRHAEGEIETRLNYNTIELSVSENEPGFFMELWGTSPNTYSINIISPTGEMSGRIFESFHANREVNFIFSKTRIFIDYRIVETYTGDQLILIRFQNPIPGIWKLEVYTRGDLKGKYDIWLPMDEFISNSTYFLASSSNTTILSPSDSNSSIAITAYNPETGGLYQEAGKGFTRTGAIKPELAAPGEGVVVPTLEKTFTTASGTSIAAAHTTGIAAMLLEWGIVRGNYPGMDSVEIKKFLIRGANRDSNLQYPNREWGYGTIDIYNVFNVLRGTSPSR